MANRSITVTLRANVQDFKSQFDAASRAADQTAKTTEDSAKRSETAMGRMVQSAQENRQAWNTAGTTLTAFGAAALGGLGLATKAAMDWESAWVGVTKVVDGTDEQMASLEAGLRNMARELPATHAEIAEVAAAAGQLGVAVPDIENFTRTMIDLGEATNMTAQEGAMNLARFMNIMGTSQSDVNRLGSSIVGLGNNFETTESELVAMSLRLAGTSNQIGLTEGEVLGLAAAMSSVGIEAQAGGTAMSMGMRKISEAVDQGGDSLEGFAEVAGMSADEFGRLWEDDPAAGLEAFVVGLERVSNEGGNVASVLSDLGIRGIRESDTFLRLAGAADSVGEAMARGNAEFEANSALIEEAANRYETAESRMRMAGNAIVDAGISIGATFLPAVAGATDVVADLAGGFADLPAPVHAVAGGLAGVAGAVGLSAGGFLLLAPRVLDTVSAFRDLGAISPGTASRVGRMTLAVGKVGLGLGVAAAAFPAFVKGANAAADAIEGVDRASLDLGMNEMSSNLLDAARSGDAFNSILGDLYDSGAVTTDTIGDLGEAVQKVAFLETGGGIEGWFARVGNAAGMTRRDIQSLQDRFDSAGEAITMMAQTDLPMAQQAFAEFWADASEGGATFDEVMAVLPGFRDELIGVAEAMEVGTDDATLLKIATGELTPVVDEATGAITGFEEGMEGAAEATQSVAEAAEEAITAMSDLASEFINAERSAMDYADALDETNDLVKENGKAWEDGTEAGDENKRMLLDLADQAWATADALSADNKSGTFLEGAREDLIDVATEMIGSREEAEKYVDQLLGTPDEIETIVKLEAEAAREEWDTLWDELGYHPPLVIDPEVDPDDKVPQFTGLISDIPPETNTDVNVDTDEAAEKAWGFQGVIEGATEDQDVNVTADTDAGEATLRAFQTAVNESGGTVEINGETMYADEALDTLIEEVNAGDGTVTINGHTFPADTSLMALIEAINLSDGEVDVYAETSSAESDANHAARDRNSTVNQTASTGSAERGLNHAARTRYSTISVSYSVRGGVPTMNVGNRTATARAMGGPVFGPGTETSDSIHAKLSNNEHVVAAREVKAAGGHQAMYSLRQQLMSGAKTIHLATGGAADGSVGPVRSSPVNQPARAQSVSASVDTGAVTSAVAAGMQGMTVALNLDGRTLYGAVIDSGKSQRAPFVTGRG